MSHDVSNLTGAELDRRVAQAIGLTVETAARDFRLGCPDWLECFHPSRSWMHGGPIIDARHFCCSVRWASDFCAVEVLEDSRLFTVFYGKDMLEAYMRALVWWKEGGPTSPPP